MGDALAEAQLQQAGNQFWGWPLATVVLAGYFTLFLMQHLPPPPPLNRLFHPFLQILHPFV